jgi:hypothetical protein
MLEGKITQIPNILLDALGCLNILYREDSLPSGGLPAQAARWCAIAATRARDPRSTGPCPEEQAWQRSTLEALLRAQHAAETPVETVAPSTDGS